MDCKVRKQKSKREPGGGRGFGRVEELVHDGMESLFRILHHSFMLFLEFRFQKKRVEHESKT